MAAVDDGLDPRLVQSARGYILSLTSIAARRDAEDYALMPSQEFQARHGPGFDTMEQKIDAVLAAIRQQPVVGGGPLTRTAQWIEATPSRRAATVLGALVTLAGALAVIAEALVGATPPVP